MKHERRVRPRFANGLAVTDTGNPSPGIPDGIVDIGAHEAARAGDCNWDGCADLLDYEVFFSCLTGAGQEATPASRIIDLDGDVDLVDHAAFQGWFTGGVS